MSIIINALKKVEKQKTEIPRPVIQERVPLKNRYWIDIIIIIIVATIIGTVMSTVFIKISKHPETKEIKRDIPQKIPKQEKDTSSKTAIAKKEKSLIQDVKKTIATFVTPKEEKKDISSQTPIPQATLPPNHLRTNPVGFKLSGIMWDARTPIALINNQFLKEGESINNGTVIKIKKSHVIIKLNNQKYILRIT